MDKFKTIGLFPLKIVMFPEAVYPFHIFEDRYKKLIKDCIANDKELGINFMTGNKMSEVGCTCKVLDVYKTYPDGKMDISLIGVNRYRIVNFIEGEKPYFLGNIELMEDNNTLLRFDLIEEATELFNELIKTIKVFKIEPIKGDEFQIRTASFYIAQKCGLSLGEKQFLLEMNSESSRLEYLIHHIKKIMPTLEKASTIDNIIKNDGYL